MAKASAQSYEDAREQLDGGISRPVPNSTDAWFVVDHGETALMPRVEAPPPAGRRWWRVAAAGGGLVVVAALSIFMTRGPKTAALPAGVVAFNGPAPAAPAAAAPTPSAPAPAAPAIAPAVAAPAIAPAVAAPARVAPARRTHTTRASHHAHSALKHR
jgi:hypothetical protein